MTAHNLFYYPYASFANAQLPLLKVAALHFDKLVLLDPVGASWDTIGAEHIARDAVRLLKDADILEIVTPAAVLAKYEQPIAEAVRRDMADHEFLELCDAHGRTSGKQLCTLSLAKVPKDVQTYQFIWYLIGKSQVLRESEKHHHDERSHRTSANNAGHRRNCWCDSLAHRCCHYSLPASRKDSCPP